MTEDEITEWLDGLTIDQICEDGKDPDGGITLDRYYGRLNLPKDDSKERIERKASEGPSLKRMSYTDKLYSLYILIRMRIVKFKNFFLKK